MRWFLETGGVMIYPLLFSSVLVLSIVLEKTAVLISKKISPRRLFSLRNSVLHSGNLPESDPVRHIILGDEDETSYPLNEREQLISLRGEEYLQRLKIRLPLLSLLGRISPMMGLTGTVLGLTDTFKKVAGTPHIPDISQLAGGIWEAMLTTIVGLLVGLTAMVAHHLIEAQIKRFGFELRLLGETLLLRDKR